MRLSAVIALSGAAALAMAAGSSVVPVAGAPSQPPPLRTLDAEGINVDALRGVVVWESQRGGRAALVRKVGGRRAMAIPGARRLPWSGDILSSGSFRGLDLGLDRRGRVAATYEVCGRLRCSGWRDVDARSGRERRLTVPTPPGCRVWSAVTRWRARVAALLLCRGTGRSGVYVADGRHTRLVRGLSDARARAGDVDLDLTGHLLVGMTANRIWVASLDRPRCRSRDVRLPGWVNLAEVQAAPGRVWWGISVAGDFGGSASEFATAAVGPGCAITEKERISSFPELDWSSGSFAVDGPTVYVAGRETGGVVSQPIGPRHSPDSPPGV
jgi:hypothetical protein